MKALPRRFQGRHVQRGVAAIELAIVLPCFLLLIFGGISYGIALYNQAVITNASREAARTGIMFKVPAATDSEIIQAALDYCQANLVTFGTPAEPDVAVDYSSGRQPGDPLTVSIRYAFTGINFSALPNPGTLQARATMSFE